MNNLRHQPPGGGPFQNSIVAVTSIAAGIASVIGAPLIYEMTAPYFLQLAARSYGRDMLALLDIAWFIFSYPAVFFVARASFYLALTSAVSLAALRFAM